MSKKDTVAKKYMSNNEYFADAFNYLFDGRIKIMPDDLREEDPVELAIIQKSRKIFANQKVRDILKKCIIKHTDEATFVLLGIENQSDIHYAMPVKNLVYDALNYAEQVEAIKKAHLANKDYTSNDEFLSGFGKTDKIRPVITLVIYFGEKPWDGPRSLFEMMDPQYKAFTAFADDYHIHLIVPEEIKDFKKFDTELGHVLMAIKYSKDKQKMERHVKNNPDFSAIQEDSFAMINAFTGLNAPVIEEGGRINMCKAMDEMLQESLEKGKLEGKTEGKVEGKAEGMITGALNTLFVLVKDGSLPIAIAVSNAVQYGIKNESDFRAAAKEAGYEIP